MNVEPGRLEAASRVPGPHPSVLRRATGVAWAAVGLLAALLVCRTLALVWALARPMPYWDAWEFMRTLPAVLDGRYGLADLLAFHNEHRIVTTRLLMIADARVFAASGTLTTAVLVAILCATGCLLGFVAAGRSWRGAVAAALATSLMLSLSQWENYASGFQVQFPLLDLSAVACVGLFAAACGSRRPLPLLAGAVAADALAIGCMASGNAVVAAIALVALLLRARISSLLAVAVPALAMTAAYMVGYPRPAIPPSHDAVGIALFAAEYLGSALRGIPGAPGWFGAALLLAYAAILLGQARAWRRGERLDPVLAWLAGVAAFLALNAVVTAVGRLNFGIESSISSRYSIQSLLFIACVFLMGWRLAGAAVRGAWLQWGPAAACLAVSAASTLAPLGLLEWRNRVADYDAAGAAFASGVFADAAVAAVHPKPGWVRPALAFMAAHRLGPFSTRYATLYRPPLNALAGQAVDALPTCAAAVDGVTRTGGDGLQIAGWAVLPARPTEDGWMLAFDPEGRLLGFARQDLGRPDVAAALHVAPVRLGYRLDINLARQPARAVTLVLVPDGEAGTACRTGSVDPGPA